jgi:hypothetical protein
LLEHQGSNKVQIIIGYGSGARKIESNIRINFNEEIKKKIDDLLGQDKVSFIKYKNF